MWFRYSLFFKSFSLKSNFYLLIMCFSYKNVRLGCGWLWSIQRRGFFPQCSLLFCTATSYLSLRAVQGAPGFVTVRNAWAEFQTGVWQEETSPFRGCLPEQEGRTGETGFSESWERAIAVPCISWAVITDLTHALNLLQRQVQIVSSKLFHLPCLSWHEAAHWAAVPQTSHATRDKPTIYLFVIQKSPFSV